MRPELGELTLKPPTFDMSAMDKYTRFRNFRLQVNKMLQTCNTNDANRIFIIKNWLLGRVYNL